LIHFARAQYKQSQEE